MTLILEFILIFPLLYRVFQINPKLGLFVGFSIELVFQLVAPIIPLFRTYPYLFDTSIFRYFFAISLGLWFSGNHNLFAKRNSFVWAGTPVSIMLLFLYIFYGFTVFYPGEHGWWGIQNLLLDFHIALVFLIGMRLLPSTGELQSKTAHTIARPFIAVADRTYHILLVQTAYFFLYFIHVDLINLLLLPQTNFWYIPSKMLLAIVEISICALLGFGLFWLDTTLQKQLKRTHSKDDLKNDLQINESSAGDFTAALKNHIES